MPLAITPGRRPGWRCAETGFQAGADRCRLLKLFAAAENLGDVQAHEQAFVSFGAVGALLPALQGEILLTQRMVGIAQLQQQISQRIVTSVAVEQGLLHHRRQQLHHLLVLTLGGRD